MKLSEKPTSQLTDEEVRLIISRQNYLERKADIDYMCYYLKIDKARFWKEFLWGWLDNMKNINQPKNSRQNAPNRFKILKN